MSKLSFRARALDATKPLPIYNAVDLPDLSEYNTINRAVPQMPTGMEKEEETERHLQDVIHAQQTNRNIKHVVIPTPENAINVPYYDAIATRVDKPPAQYIRLPGLSLDEDVPDYDLDSEDEEWLSLQTDEKPLSSIHFERMMDKLEKGSGNTVLSDRDAQALLRDDEDLVLAVYEYWLGKRLRLGRALIPMVKQERRDGTASGNNPYLAFRKRTEKMQTRKNRKNDETAYMQMQKLKRDLDKSFTLAGMVKEREAKKHELATIQMDIFKKRFLLEDWSGNILSSLSPVATQSATSRQNSNVSNSAWDGSSVLIKMEGGDDYDVHQVGRHEVLVATGIKRRSRKRKYYFPASSLESPLPPMPATPDKGQDPSRSLSTDKFQGDEELDGRFTFRRKPHVKYCPARTGAPEWPWEYDVETGSVEEAASDGEEEGRTTRARIPKPKKFRFSRLTLSGQYIGLCRRRVGRGGRVTMDRLCSDFTDTDLGADAELGQQMEAEPSLHSSSPPPSAAASLSHTPIISTPNSNNHTPATIARQQSEVLSSAVVPGDKLGGLLVRSQSVQAVIATPKDTPTAEPAAGGGQGEEPEKTAVAQSPHIQSYHYVDQPSSPNTNSEVSSLPFLKQLPAPAPADSTEHAHFPPHYAVPGEDGYARGSFSLRRLPSFSECREEMTTFSSLPTSHFTLRPSSSDAELQQSPTQFWNQTSFGYKDSWNWNQTSNEKLSWQRKSSGEQISGNNNNTSSQHHPSAAPSNYGSNLIGGAYPNNVKRSLVQQVSAADQEVSVKSSKTDMSRSSLSVTDSKTIVLTNSPGPWLSATGDKKREVDKLLGQQQNHKLVNKVSGAVRTEDEQEGGTERNKKLRVDRGGPDRSDSKGNDVVKSEGVSSKSTEGTGVSGGNKGAVSESGADDAHKQAAKDAESSQTSSENDSGIAASSGTSTGGGGSSSSGSRASPLEKSSVDKAAVERLREGSVKEASPKVVDVWSVKGPSNGILLLNSRRGTKRDSKGKPKKLRGSQVGLNLESAHSIASQFVAKTAKKEDSVVVGGLVGDMVPSLGGILVRGSAAGSRSGSNTPTILGAAVDMSTQQILPGIGAIGAAVTGLGVGRLASETQANSSAAPVVSQPLQENMVIAKGVEVKRTNSIGSDGIGVHVTLSSQSSGGLTAHHPTGSTGTNGTNFKEIFNAKRKLSENSERGLKQALAGTVVNHSTLLENTAKPLLQQAIKNSSEVT